MENELLENLHKILAHERQRVERMRQEASDYWYQHRQAIHRLLHKDSQ